MLTQTYISNNNLLEADDDTMVSMYLMANHLTHLIEGGWMLALFIDHKTITIALSARYIMYLMVIIEKRS